MSFMKSSRLFIVNKIIHLLPPTGGFRMKRALFRLCGVTIGDNVRICSSVTILGDSRLSIGDNTWIGHDTFIIATAPVAIGKNVNIAPRCYLGTGTHIIDIDGESIAGKGESLPITIGDGSWLCTHSVILAGCDVGSHSIIAAGAVVTKGVPDKEMWGGVPAKFIKTIK